MVKYKFVRVCFCCVDNNRDMNIIQHKHAENRTTFRYESNMIEFRFGNVRFCCSVELPVFQEL